MAASIAGTCVAGPIGGAIGSFLGQHLADLYAKP